MLFIYVICTTMKLKLQLRSLRWCISVLLLLPITSSATGALVRSEDISKGYGILTLSAQSFANGAYVYQLVLEGRMIESGKFIISY